MATEREAGVAARQTSEHVKGSRGYGSLVGASLLPELGKEREGLIGRFGQLAWAIG